MRKSPTGIRGFDDITGGGLPTGRTTLLEGGAGSGKTVLALQSLIAGAQIHHEPGIFVAFEESPARIAANAAGFGWDIAALDDTRLFFIDARPHPDLVQTGAADLAGLLAALDARVAAMGARRIVFDAIDIVLALMGDTAAMRREAYRLHDWLQARELTAIITVKSVEGRRAPTSLPPLDFLQFMVDCAVQLEHGVVAGVSQREIRVCKYRGSAFEENAIPFAIGAGGIEVAFTQDRGQPAAPASDERISSGISRLDRMLGGGYFRGASILLTGAPGTAKTTLSGAFAEAACLRGEKALFVTFDSRSDEIIRNLASVGIRLERFVETGQLRMVSMRALAGSAENHFLRIRAAAQEQGTRCLIADPISALGKSGNRGTAPGVAERLIDWAKAAGLTVLCTSLLDEVNEPTEGTPLQISTIADTWIHLNYVQHAGERNRGISIIKSRGTAHSNQVRELVLASDGVTLADVYTAGGEVLMGTLRWRRERDERLAARRRAVEAARQQAHLHAEAAEIEARMAMLKAQLEARRLALEGLHAREAEEIAEGESARAALQERRAGAGGSPAAETAAEAARDDD